MPAHRKPTALRVLEGRTGARYHQPAGVSEPRPKPIAPKAPAWLDPEARAHWRDLAPKLDRLGLLTEVDGFAFAAVCRAWSSWRALDALADAAPADWRAAVAARESLKVYRSLAAEFGLTPASRTRVHVVPETPRDPIEDLLD